MNVMILALDTKIKGIKGIKPPKNGAPPLTKATITPANLSALARIDLIFFFSFSFF